MIIYINYIMYKNDKLNNESDYLKIQRKNDIRKKPTEKANEIINFYEVIPKKYLDTVENPNFHLHNIEIPFRMCVVAPSGSGKTNFVLNLIRVFSQGKGTFTDITIVTRNKDEPLYNWLAGQSDNIKIMEGMHNNPKLDDFDKKYNHLLIWDDLVLSKNLDPVCEYYLRARKKNVSLLFLSQSYTDIPKMIRKNSTYLVLFDLGGSKREQDYIMREWSGELDKDELRAIYEDAVKEKLSPLIIKGGRTKGNEKYRKGFVGFYDLKTFLLNIERVLPKSKRRVKKVEPVCENSDIESD
jgi:hypothetical protein